ncbi:24601_t:CDS:2, partial [Gigaspora margarita]
IKIRSGEITRGRKPKWFSLLEEKIIEKAEEKTIKPEWISWQLNQSASSILLPEITNDKRKKEWILSEEGEAFKIREKKDKSIQENKKKGDIAVMGAAVIQVNEKEEVSLEEVSAYTIGWPLSTRAELLAIWIATLIFLCKTEVVVKTDSAVSIINIESSKHIATAR